MPLPFPRRIPLPLPLITHTEKNGISRTFLDFFRKIAEQAKLKAGELDQQTQLSEKAQGAFAQADANVHITEKAKSAWRVGKGCECGAQDCHAVNGCFCHPVDQVAERGGTGEEGVMCEITHTDCLLCFSFVWLAPHLLRLPSPRRPHPDYAKVLSSEFGQQAQSFYTQTSNNIKSVHEEASRIAADKKSAAALASEVPSNNPETTTATPAEAVQTAQQQPVTTGTSLAGAGAA